MTTGDGGWLVVSVHDIASSTADEAGWLLDRLDAIGVTRRVLKVVPRWKGTDDIRRDAALAARLREDAARGSEVMLHGLTHALEAEPLGPWHQRLRIRAFAPGDSEFAGVDDRAARQRIVDGARDLAEVGLRSPGFCPPAWIAPGWLDGILADLDFRFVVRAAEVHDLVAGTRHRWPAAGYMGVGGTHERLYELQREVTIRAPIRPRVLRVYLHPQGARSSPACGRALRRIRRLVAERHVATYEELLSSPAASARA